MISDDEFDIEPMTRTRPPSRAPSVTALTEAERQRKIKKKRRTLDDRLDELADYNKKLYNVNEAVLLLDKASILLSNHETFNEDF
jgi:hypothetical protein